MTIMETAVWLADVLTEKRRANQVPGTATERILATTRQKASLAALENVLVFLHFFAGKNIFLPSPSFQKDF